ncbi:MAG TPA: hypothetical protein DCR93_05670, partial [Cytophagales bacterium]|nr:hypothetical protein [Cytophagales bacterium]
AYRSVIEGSNQDLGQENQPNPKHALLQFGVAILASIVYICLKKIRFSPISILIPSHDKLNHQLHSGFLVMLTNYSMLWAKIRRL